MKEKSAFDKIGANISKAGSFISKTAGKGKDVIVQKTEYYAKDVPKMKRESIQMKDDAIARYNKAIGELTALQQMTKVILEKLYARQDFIVKNQMERLAELYKYSHELDDSRAALKRISMDKAEQHFYSKYEDFAPYGTSKGILKGLFTGGAAAGTAVGLTALFGTASTGTAIASLHGAAAVNSVLAALGGGSLAAGGAGIAGGIAVLGGLFIAPAVITAGYFWGKNVEADFHKAKQYQRDVNDAVERAAIIKENLTKAAEVYQKNIFVTDFLSATLNTLLNLFERDLALNQYDSVRILLEKAYNCTADLLNLPIVDKDNQLNPHLNAELDAVNLNLQSIQRELGFYLLSSKILPAVETKYVKSTFKILYNETIGEYFRRAFADAQQDLYIISPWIHDWIFSPGDKYNLMALFEQALKRSVHIHIAYGYKQGRDSDIEKDRRNASRLYHKFSAYGSYLHIHETNTHAKAVICDDAYMLHGSFNFLSFKGDYSNNRTRSEIASYTDNKIAIQDVKNTFFAEQQ